MPGADLASVAPLKHPAFPAPTGTGNTSGGGTAAFYNRSSIRRLRAEIPTLPFEVFPP